MNFNTANDLLFKLSADISSKSDSAEYKNMLQLTEEKNPWFTKEMTETALKNLSVLMRHAPSMIRNNYKEEFLKSVFKENKQNKTILIVCAGNIPAVSFTDIVLVLISGYKVVIKLSSNDDVIIPYLINRLMSFYPELGSRIEYLSSPLTSIQQNIDGVIATGSTATSTVFEQYFRNIPHIIRKSRYSVAIIDTLDNITGLEDDICLYYGLGCRSVSHIFVPENYDFPVLIQRSQQYHINLKDNNKYRNNLDYQKAIMIMNNIPFIDADAVLLRENNELSSPVGVVNYSFYDNISEVKTILTQNKSSLQCIVACYSNAYTDFAPSVCRFGNSQRPEITDYADGIDVLQFLNNI